MGGPDVFMQVTHHGNRVDGSQHLVEDIEGFLLGNVDRVHVLQQGGFVILGNQSCNFTVLQLVLELEEVGGEGGGFAHVQQHLFVIV